MNTQTPSIHIRLWHRDFWLMVLANLLLSSAVTMLIPVLPLQAMYVAGASTLETGLIMGIFALGLFLPGGLCSYLVQHYRRNMVCVWAVLALAVTIVVPRYWPKMPLEGWLLDRLLQGAAYGLAQMVLSSTLIIDTCESFQRTEANHSATWFGRFALSIGPMAGLLFYQHSGYGSVALLAVACLLGTCLLILMVHFPFRVPEDDLRFWSLDRFFLKTGWPLFAGLLLFTCAIGLSLSLRLETQFYGFMMIGFLMALLAQNIVFSDADLKSEVVSGGLLVVASLLILHFSPSSPLCSPLLGLGAGLIGSRFLLFFIKLSRHCQRGTSQSTFLLGWESGLSLGIGLGFAAFSGQEPVLVLALAVATLALMLYVTAIHGWFLKHKNR